MPGGDRTGPAGMGPMTGRAGGYCAGYPTPGFMNPSGRLRGGWFGRGRGGGWGFGGAGRMWAEPFGWAPYGAPYSAEQEKQALGDQIRYFEDQLAAVKKRIAELEAEATEEQK